MLNQTDFGQPEGSFGKLTRIKYRKPLIYHHFQCHKLTTKSFACTLSGCCGAPLQPFAALPLAWLPGPGGECDQGPPAWPAAATLPARCPLQTPAAHLARLPWPTPAAIAVAALSLCVFPSYKGRIQPARFAGPPRT